MLDIISENILMIIENNNMSIKKFAKKIGFSQPAVSKWIAKDKYPSIQAIASICENFNVSADWLIFGK